MTADELRKLASRKFTDQVQQDVLTSTALMRAATELDRLTAAHTAAVEALNVAAVQLDEKDEKLAALRRENKRLQAVADATAKAVEETDQMAREEAQYPTCDSPPLAEVRRTLSALRGDGGEGGHDR